MSTRRRRALLASVAVTASIASVGACSASGDGSVDGQTPDAAMLEASSTRVPEGQATSKLDATPSLDAGSEGGDAKAETPSIIINEVFVDNDGLGDGVEFVELYGPPNTPLAGLKLRLIDHVGQVKYTVPVGSDTAALSSEGYWVVSGGQVFKLNASPYREDQTVSIASWGLDNARGAVQLVRGTNELVDVVGWGQTPDAGPLSPPPTNPMKTSEGANVLVPALARHSFGRKPPANVDTNDNAADFCSMVPTPGFAQKACD